MRTTSQEEGGAGLVFLVASHKNPTQVARLVARLAADLPEAAIVVHHDQSKSPLSRSQLPACADLMDTFVAATWGTASLAEISTSGLAYIARRYHDYRWVVFLSGQDYPVRGLRTLPAQLASMKDGYIDVEPPGIAEPLRYELGWFRLPERLQTAAMREVFERLIFHLNSKQSFVRFASGRLGCTVGVRMPRPIPRNWRFYQGSNWWCLARPAIETYLGYRREKPQYLRWFFERTLVPDEGIYQTLLLNAPGLEFSKTDIRYIRWDDRNSGSPAILGMRDLPELRASGRYFARKFDIEVDAAVFDALDTRCRDD